MSKWIIDKEFGFDYGHRVWSQELVDEFSLGHKCVCRHLHGHRGKLHVFLEADHLEKGMVTDFHHLNWLKNFIDDNIDHKFIIDKNDPWFEFITNGALVTGLYEIDDGEGGTECSELPAFQIQSHIKAGRSPLKSRIRRLDITVPETDHVVCQTLDVSTLEGPEQEFLEGFVFVDFLPTSENLCKWIYDFVQLKMDRLGVKVQRVEFYETPKSRSTYLGG